MYVYTSIQGLLSVQAVLISSSYNGSLVTWTVVRFTAAKFKPLIFSVSGFAFSNIVNIFILWFCMTSACWLHNFVIRTPCDGLIPRPVSSTDCLRIKRRKWNKAFHGCSILQSGRNRRGGGDVRKFESHLHITDRRAPRKISNGAENLVLQALISFLYVVSLWVKKARREPPLRVSRYLPDTFTLALWTRYSLGFSRVLVIGWLWYDNNINKYVIRLLFVRCPVLISAWLPANFAEVLHVFPPSFQENGEIIPSDSSRPLHQNSIALAIHGSIPNLLHYRCSWRSIIK
jgi:hypothetical protein